MPINSGFHVIWTDEFLAEHQLPSHYLTIAQPWLVPVIDQIASQQQGQPRTLLVGLNGCQGSGKSTLAALMVEMLKRHYGLTALAVSLDDFYLTKAERLRLAEQVHPLLATRGVPGTHDVALMAKVMSDLMDQKPLPDRPVLVPEFDKSTDDRRSEERWPRITEPVSVIIWEGWCLGVPPQEESALIAPCNRLEDIDDRDGFWRRYVNRQLHEYQPLFRRVDYWLMLKPPSFACVSRWRGEQETKLAQRCGKGPGIMMPTEVSHFVQLYERLTQWALHILPPRMNTVFELDAHRRIVASSRH